MKKKVVSIFANGKHVTMECISEEQVEAFIESWKHPELKVYVKDDHQLRDLLIMIGILIGSTIFSIVILYYLGPYLTQYLTK